MSFRRVFVTILTVAALAGTVAMAQTTTTITVTREATYPPVGLASSETAQINVANLASNSAKGTAASCSGTIAFLNSSGVTIGSATPFTVTSGQIYSVSLPFAKTGASVRTEIRGVIGYSTTSDVPCTLSSSLETYDSTTGVTHIFLSNDATAAGGPAPASEPGPGL
jgi:hypothetical protein